MPLAHSTIPILPASPPLPHAHRVQEWWPGLRLHADDAIDQADADPEGWVSPGLHLVVLLEGQLSLRYGEREIELLARPRGRPRQAPLGDSRREGVTLGEAPAAQAVWVQVSRPERFSRQVRQGRYARRLSLTLSPDWLASLWAQGRVPAPPRLLDLCRHHLSAEQVQPSARSVALAEQLVRPPCTPPVQRQLYQCSRTLDLLADMLGHWQGLSDGPAGHAGSLTARLRALRAFLDSEAAHGLSMAQIASRAGMSENALQQHFREAYGTSVMAFVRESRLQRARLALERDGASVKRAAAVAGYSSAANFATAYLRRFGTSPSQAGRAARR